MKEKGNNQSQEKVVHLPPVWCGSICRNAMSEVCIEHCAIKRDCSNFNPKPNLKLDDMPRFPIRASASMTKEEKFTSVAVYLAKVVDHLKGVEDPEQFNFRRPSRPVTVYERKAVAEVAASLHSLQKDLQSEDANKTESQLTQASSNPSHSFTNFTNKEDE
jgi:hypothetical protein